MEVIATKKISLTKEEVEMCVNLYELYYSDDDLFTDSNDLVDFLLSVKRDNESFKDAPIIIRD